MRLVEVLAAGSLLLAGGSLFIAALTFSKNTRVRRAEWLLKLYEKYYEDEERKRIRRALDGPVKASLIENLKSESDPDALESFADYLNFFEFLGSLVEMNQIKKDEVRMMFDYYVRQLDDEGIKTFCSEQGYENTLKLVKTVPS